MDIFILILLAVQVCPLPLNSKDKKQGHEEEWRKPFPQSTSTGYAAPTASFNRFPTASSLQEPTQSIVTSHETEGGATPEMMRSQSTSVIPGSATREHVTTDTVTVDPGNLITSTRRSSHTWLNDDVTSDTVETPSVSTASPVVVQSFISQESEEEYSAAETAATSTLQPHHGDVIPSIAADSHSYNTTVGSETLNKTLENHDHHDQEQFDTTPSDPDTEMTSSIHDQNNVSTELSMALTEVHLQPNVTAVNVEDKSPVREITESVMSADISSTTTSTSSSISSPQNTIRASATTEIDQLTSDTVNEGFENSGNHSTSGGSSDYDNTSTTTAMMPMEAFTKLFQLHSDTARVINQVGERSTLSRLTLSGPRTLPEVHNQRTTTPPLPSASTAVTAAVTARKSTAHANVIEPAPAGNSSKIFHLGTREFLNPTTTATQSSTSVKNKNMTPTPVPDEPNLVEPGHIATLPSLKTDTIGQVVLSNKTVVMGNLNPTIKGPNDNGYIMNGATVPPVTLPQNLALFVKLQLNISIKALCAVEVALKTKIAKLVNQYHPVNLIKEQVMLWPLEKDCPGLIGKFIHKRGALTSLFVFITDTAGHYSYNLTNLMVHALQEKPISHIIQATFLGKVVVSENVVGSIGPAKHAAVVEQKTSSGIVAAIIIPILVVVLVVVAGILFLMYRTHQRRVNTKRCVRHSMTSLNDTYMLHALVRSGSARFGFSNPGLEAFGEDFISNPLNEKGCEDMLQDMEKIHDEFTLLPNKFASFTSVPEGAEFKNRFPNVIPNTHSRVVLKTVHEEDPVKAYINANYIRGYLGYPKSYIVTQAPTKETRADFWAMIWQQHSSLIIMATDFEENSKSCCCSYWPNTEGGDITVFYGNICVTQKNHQVESEWIQTSLTLTSKSEPGIEKDVEHIWLTAWPSEGLPDYRSILKFFRHVRPMIEESSGPPTIHCCPGTGRSGVLVAIDIGLVAYNHCKKFNIPHVVYQIRLDRGGLVRTKEQYAFIYKVLYEYSKACATPSLSSRSSVSSVASLHLAGLSH